MGGCVELKFSKEKNIIPIIKSQGTYDNEMQWRCLYWN